MNFDLLKTIVDQQPNPLLFATVSGAHLYGFPSPNSDFDIRGVHILPLPQVVGLNKPEDTLEFSGIVEGSEIDLVTYDVFKFFTLLLRSNGNILEQIYSPLIVHTTPEHEELKAITRDCITWHYAHHYLGFAQNQWELFSKENPPRIKPLLYVYRVLLTGIHLLNTSEVEANLVNLNEHFKLPYITDLIERKMAGSEHEVLPEGDLTFYRQEFERLRSALDEARDNSPLPEAYTCTPALNELRVRIGCK